MNHHKQITTKRLLLLCFSMSKKEKFGVNKWKIGKKQQQSGKYQLKTHGKY